MANENVTVNMENLSTEEKEQLLALIKKANEPVPESKVWKPDEDEEYWFIDEEGDVYRYAWDCFCGQGILTIGNCFRTKEEAEFTAERLKVLQKLKELANGYQHKHLENNYFLYYSHEDNEIKIADNYEVKRNDIYFATREEAEAAIKAVGEDRIKKYYFCV